ncbi:MAG TPA: acyltransferase domain-containing protein [Polyangiaceae bacterium]|nr:acyltransferase domain-containing protein [Polyangiaceae bacterium]
MTIIERHSRDYADAQVEVLSVACDRGQLWLGWVEAASPSAAARAVAALPKRATEHRQRPLRQDAFLGDERRVRTVTIGASLAEVESTLKESVRQPWKPAVSRGLAFLWTGQGAQYPRMAAGMERRYPLVRRLIERAEHVLAPLLGRSPRDVLHGDNDEINETVFAQPLLFVLEYALARLWQAAGITPAISLGHSVGELAAACDAGVLELDDALRMVAARGLAMQRMPSSGAMATVMLEEASVLGGLPETVEVAAVNGPESVVISGPEVDVAAAIKAFEDAGVQCQRLVVSHAFHSEMMAPAVTDFEHAVSGFPFRPPTTPLISNVSGGPHRLDQPLDAAYFARHIRATVRFADGLRAIDESGVRHFLELGPRPTLSVLARRALGRADRAFVASLVPDLDEPTALLNAGATLFELGYAVDFTVLAGASDGAPA